MGTAIRIIGTRIIIRMRTRIGIRIRMGTKFKK